MDRNTLKQRRSDRPARWGVPGPCVGPFAVLLAEAGDPGQQPPRLPLRAKCGRGGRADSPAVPEVCNLLRHLKIIKRTLCWKVPHTSGRGRGRGEPVGSRRRLWALPGEATGMFLASAWQPGEPGRGPARPLSGRCAATGEKTPGGEALLGGVFLQNQ